MQGRTFQCAAHVFSVLCHFVPNIFFSSTINFLLTSPYLNWLLVMGQLHEPVTEHTALSWLCGIQIPIYVTSTVEAIIRCHEAVPPFSFHCVQFHIHGISYTVMILCILLSVG